MRELEALEQRMAEPGFWNDQKAAQTQLQRRKRVESDLELLRRLKREEDDAQVLGDWLAGGEDVARDFETALDALEQTVETCEFQKMLGGEHDRANAILTINAGAGGTDSQDWAEILLRMYLRWCDRHGYKRDIAEIQAGEEAGIKSVTVIVQGGQTPRVENAAVQYFARLFGETSGEGRRVVYAEGLWDEDKALNLLGTLRLDGRLSVAVFNDPFRMYRDILADVARAAIDDILASP